MRSGLIEIRNSQRLRAAHESGGEATDDAALVEAAGGTVVVVAGDPRNVKVTTVADLVLVEALLSESEARP